MLYVVLFISSWSTPSFADITPPEDTSDTQDTSDVQDTSETANSGDTGTSEEKTGCQTISNSASLMLLFPAMLLAWSMRRKSVLRT